MSAPSNPSSKAYRFPAACAVILGTNEIASAIAVHIYRAGWSAVLSHDPHPPVIRRRMAFHDALFGEHAQVEGIKAANGDTGLEVAALLAKGEGVAITRLTPLGLATVSEIQLLIDARMQKREVSPDLRHLAALDSRRRPGIYSGRKLRHRD